MAEQKQKREQPIPIAWRTCPYCGERYDEGNPFAAFDHRYRVCLRPATPEASR